MYFAKSSMRMSIWNFCITFRRGTSIKVWESAHEIADVHGDFKYNTEKKIRDFQHAGPNTLKQVTKGKN